MRTILDRIWESRWKDALLPLSFLFGNLLNFVFYYLGLAYKDNAARTYGFIIGQLLFAVLCGLALLAALKNKRLSKLSWLCLGAVLLFYGANYAAGLVRHGLSGPWKDSFVHFVCFALPAFFAGICCALSHSERRFLPLMERLSFLVLPGAVIYMNGLLFYCNPFGYNRYLGIMDYMYFAYTVMPFLLVHIIRFTDKEDLEFPLFHKKTRHPQLIRGAMIIVYWVSIIGSGTRGTCVCVVAFCVLLVLSKLLHRESLLRPFLLSVSITAIMLFNMFVYAPPGMYAVARMNMFVDGLKQGEIVTSLEDSENAVEKIDELVAADGDKQLTNRDEPTEPVEPAEPTEPTEPTDIADENLVIANRGTLYKLAWKEFLKAPLTGMGFGGYQVKYGGTPHNAILELLCEGGLLLGGPILLLILFALIRLFCLAWNDRSTRYLLLIFLAYAIRANIGGGVWTCDYLLCALGFSFALSLSSPNSKSVFKRSAGSPLRKASPTGASEKE